MGMIYLVRLKDYAWDLVIFGGILYFFSFLDWIMILRFDSI